MANYGVCEQCRGRVPCEHEIRDGQVYLKKKCATCGPSEALVSTDAKIWEEKRRLYRYQSDSQTKCMLHCDTCSKNHHPRMVFLDVTNRCNMNCPICAANIPAMKFEFHPPLEYFERIFDGLAKYDPKPVVHFFGGEPTMRADLIELIELGHKKGLTIYLVTNGLKLANEEFCRQVCETGVPVLIGFDGRDPEIYARMRKQTSVYEKKLKALENLKKYSKHRRNIIMCCTARGINDEYIADLISFCHDQYSHLKGLYFLPLTEAWTNQDMKTERLTTIEDVEQIVGAAFPGEPVEFLPLGLQHHLNKALTFLNAERRQTYAGVHPNCESASKLFSDGARYHPISYFLKVPLADFAEDLIARMEKIGPTIDRLSLDSGLQVLRGRVLVMKALLGASRRAVNFERFMKGGSPRLALFKFFGGLLLGRSFGQQLAKHTVIHDSLTMLVLPFEEIHSLEGERLERCSSGFAYEDVDTGEVKTFPACSWWLYNTEILKKIQSKYGKPAREVSQRVGAE
ncbi:MAG: radical SAM protein [Planctomycetes bacterium]|nr:radical SAM protein [Planctomycetota bacterium]